MDPLPPNFTNQAPPPNGGGIKIPILFGAVLALVGARRLSVHSNG